MLQQSNGFVATGAIAGELAGRIKRGGLEARHNLLLGGRPVSRCCRLLRTSFTSNGWQLSGLPLSPQTTEYSMWLSSILAARYRGPYALRCEDSASRLTIVGALEAHRDHFSTHPVGVAHAQCNETSITIIHGRCAAKDEFLSASLFLQMAYHRPLLLSNGGG